MILVVLIQNNPINIKIKTNFKKKNTRISKANKLVVKFKAPKINNKKLSQN
jgi:hypothetical protein